MKPVEIEFLMKDALTPGLRNASKVVRQYSADTRMALKETSASLAEQKRHIQRLESEMKELEKVTKTTPPGEEWSNAAARLQALTREFTEEKAALEGLMDKEYELKNLYEASDASLKQQLRTKTQEIASLTLAYNKLSDEEKATAQGKALQQHIADITEEAGELRDVMADTMAAVNNAASDTRGFDQLAGATQVVIDGFGLATAGAELFGVSQEELVAVQTKLQAALVASNALSSIQNNLQRQSALMQGIKIIQTNAAAMAENIKTAAVGRGIVATKAATIAQAAFNAVAKANPYVLLAAACVTVVGALYAFAKGSKAAKEAEETRQKEMEKSREINENIAKSIGDTAGAQIAAYMRLRKAWIALGDDMQKRKKFVEENKQAFEELGLSINNVQDAENYLVNRTGDVVQAFILRAKAMALQDAIAQIYTDMLAEQQRIRDAARYKVYKNGDTISSVEAQERGMAGIQVSSYDPGAYSENNTGRNEKVYIYTVVDAKKFNEAGNRLAISNRDKKLQELKNQADSRIASLEAEVDSNNAAQKALNIPAPAKNGTSKPTPAKPTAGRNDAAEEEKKRAEELLDLQKENRQNEIDLMKDGAEKKKAQLKLDYDNEIAELKELEKKWKAAQGGKLTDEQEQALNGESGAAALAKKKYDDGLEEIRKEEREKEAAKLAEAQAKWNEYLMQYGDFQQKRKATAEHYDTLINKATSDGEKASLRKQLDEALKVIRFDELKASIDFADIFGDINTQSTEALAILRDKLAQYISTAANDLKPEDLKALQDAFKNIDATLLARTPFKAFAADLSKLRSSSDEVAKAQDDLDKIMAGGTVTINEYDKETGKTVTRTLSQAEAENRLAKAQNARFAQLAQATKSLQAGVAQAREYLGVASSFMDMLGDFGIEVPAELGGIVSGLGGVLDGLGSIDLTKPASVLSGSLKALGGLGKTMGNILSLGGIDFGGAKSRKRYEEAKAMYQDYMDVLDKVIDKQRDLVESMTASDWLNADNSFRYAESLVKKQEEAARNLGKRYLDAGASKGFLGIGSSASNGVSQRKGISGDAWEEYEMLKDYTEKLRELGLSSGQLADAVAGRMTGLFDMTGDQLEWIMSNAPTFWAQLDEDTRNYLEQIISCGEAWEELQDARRESLTHIGFDEFYSAWLDKIKDMTSDVHDVAESIEESFRDAILTSLMDERYRQKIRDLYEMWADMMESDGKLSKAEMERLRNERDSLAAQAIADRNSLVETFGWDAGGTGASQSGKSGGFTAISQDQGTKLEGLFVSVQMHVASIDENMEDVTAKMSMATEHLRKIEENTSRSADILEGVAYDVAVILRDGIKTR